MGQTLTVYGVRGGAREQARPPLAWSAVNGAAVLLLLGLERATTSHHVEIWRARRAVMWARGTFEQRWRQCRADAHQALGTVAAQLGDEPVGPSRDYLANQVARFAQAVEQLAADGCHRVGWTRRTVRRRSRRPETAPDGPSSEGAGA